MQRFCYRCDNIIQYRESENEKLVTQCLICDKIETLDEKDNIIFSNQENTATDMYGDVISLTPFDPAAMRVLETCDKCGSEIKFLLSLGGENKPLLYCKCQVTR